MSKKQINYLEVLRDNGFSQAFIDAFSKNHDIKKNDDFFAAMKASVLEDSAQENDAYLQLFNRAFSQNGRDFEKFLGVSYDAVGAQDKGRLFLALLKRESRKKHVSPIIRDTIHKLVSGYQRHVESPRVSAHLPEGIAHDLSKKTAEELRDIIKKVTQDQIEKIDFIENTIIAFSGDIVSAYRATGLSEEERQDFGTLIYSFAFSEYSYIGVDFSENSFVREKISATLFKQLPLFLKSDNKVMGTSHTRFFMNFLKTKLNNTNGDVDMGLYLESSAEKIGEEAAGHFLEQSRKTSGNFLSYLDEIERDESAKHEGLHESFIAAVVETATKSLESSASFVNSRKALGFLEFTLSTKYIDDEARLKLVNAIFNNLYHVTEEKLKRQPQDNNGDPLAHLNNQNVRMLERAAVSFYGRYFAEELPLFLEAFSRHKNPDTRKQNGWKKKDFDEKVELLTTTLETVDMLRHNARDKDTRLYLDLELSSNDGYCDDVMAIIDFIRDRNKGTAKQQKPWSALMGIKHEVKTSNIKDNALAGRLERAFIISLERAHDHKESVDEVMKRIGHLAKKDKDDLQSYQNLWGKLKKGIINNDSYDDVQRGEMTSVLKNIEKIYARQSAFHYSRRYELLGDAIGLRVGHFDKSSAFYLEVFRKYLQAAEKNKRSWQAKTLPLVANDFVNRLHSVLSESRTVADPFYVKKLSGALKKTINSLYAFSTINNKNLDELRDYTLGKGLSARRRRIENDFKILFTDKPSTLAFVNHLGIEHAFKAEASSEQVQEAWDKVFQEKDFEDMKSSGGLFVKMYMASQMDVSLKSTFESIALEIKKYLLKGKEDSTNDKFFHIFEKFLIAAIHKDCSDEVQDILESLRGNKYKHLTPLKNIVVKVDDALQNKVETKQNGLDVLGKAFAHSDKSIAGGLSMGGLYFLTELSPPRFKGNKVSDITQAVQRFAARAFNGVLPKPLRLDVAFKNPADQVVHNKVSLNTENPIVLPEEGAVRTGYIQSLQKPAKERFYR